MWRYRSKLTHIKRPTSSVKAAQMAIALSVPSAKCSDGTRQSPIRAPSATSIMPVDLNVAFMSLVFI